MHRFLMYLMRWQMSSPILVACLFFLSEKVGVMWATILSNLIGGAVFYWVDKWILTRGER